MPPLAQAMRQPFHAARRVQLGDVGNRVLARRGDAGRGALCGHLHEPLRDVATDIEWHERARHPQGAGCAASSAPRQSPGHRTASTAGPSSRADRHTAPANGTAAPYLRRTAFTRNRSGKRSGGDAAPGVDGSWRPLTRRSNPRFQPSCGDCANLASPSASSGRSCLNCCSTRRPHLGPTMQTWSRVSREFRRNFASERWPSDTRACLHLSEFPLQCGGEDRSRSAPRFRSYNPATLGS